MPSDKAHIEQARHNAELLRGLDIIQYPDWVITLAFYVIVHLSEAVFASMSTPTWNLSDTRHSSNHEERKKKVVRYFGRDIGSHYLALYSDSRKSRYECLWTEAEARNSLGRKYQTLRSFLCQKLGISNLP